MLLPIMKNYFVWAIVFDIHLSLSQPSQIFQSSIHLTAKGTLFQPRNSIELLGQYSQVDSLRRCTMFCNQNRQCRTFDYDYLSRICRIFEGEFSTGTVLVNATLSSSRIGAIVFNSVDQLFSSYGEACNQCSNGINRYLECINNTCRCPLHTYWNGQMCLNQLYNGSLCNHSFASCRQDLNLTCSNVSATCTPMDTAATPTSTPITTIFWDFDTNTRDLYNVYNGVPTSIAYNSPGINGYGQALQITYGVSKVNIPSPYINLQNRSYTFDCWVKPGATMYANDYLIFVLCPVTQNYQCLQVLLRNGRPMLTIWFGDCMSSNNITINVWAHLAFAYDCVANQATLYVNGFVDRICTAFPAFRGAPNATAWFGWSSTLSMYYSGLIDQFSLITRVKTTAEILDAASLVLYYSFDGDSLDDSGPNWINGTGLNVAFTLGTINQAAVFNTTPSYIQASNLILLAITNQAYSFSLWINAYSTINATLVHSWRPATVNTSCLPLLGFDSVGAIVAQKRNALPLGTIVGPIVSSNTWVHIAYTYSPTYGMELYVDAIKVGNSSVINSGNSDGPSLNIAIGHCLNSTLCSCTSSFITTGQYSGLIDEFRFYSRRLNASEIVTLANL